MAPKPGDGHVAQIHEGHQPAGDATAHALRADAPLAQAGSNHAIGEMTGRHNTDVPPQIAGNNDCKIVDPNKQGQGTEVAAVQNAGAPAKDGGKENTSTTTTTTTDTYASATYNKQVESVMGNDTKGSVSARGTSTDVSTATASNDAPATTAPAAATSDAPPPPKEQLARADQAVFNPHEQHPEEVQKQKTA